MGHRRTFQPPRTGLLWNPSLETGLSGLGRQSIDPSERQLQGACEALLRFLNVSQIGPESGQIWLFFGGNSVGVGDLAIAGIGDRLQSLRVLS